MKNYYMAGKFEIVKPKEKKIFFFDSGKEAKYVPDKIEQIRDQLSWVEKYRPKNINKVVSHKNILNFLRESIKLKKPLPHMIFHGPPGVGKTSVILALARELYGNKLYKERVLEFNASDDRGIDNVREKFKNYAEAMIGLPDPDYPSPPYKIIILDEADAMTQDAQSALRIIIERNSKNTRFVLICNYIHNISPQILSRCTKFRFNAIDDKSISERLHEISKKEELKINDNVINTIIKFANGDLRKAVMKLQKYSVYENPSADTIYEIIGVVPDINKYINKCNNVSNTIQQAKLLSREAYPVIQIFEQLVDIIIEDNNLNDQDKAHICMEIAHSEKKLIEGANEYFQLLHILMLYYSKKK